MKKILKIALVLLFAALLLGTLFFLWQKTRPEKTFYAIVEPRIDTIRQTVVATGKIEPRDEVLIKPQISGIISDLHREAGETVREGDILATVKVIPEMGALNSAEAQVTSAELTLEQTRREHLRTERLHDKGVVSHEEYEQSLTALERAREELQNARDNLEITRNGIAEKYRELSNTQIRSTIDGMILDVPVKVGNSVIQANTFNDGTTIASVADMTQMLFRGDVDETDVGKLRRGMPVRLTVGAMQDVELEAELEYIAPKATEENGIILFEVKAAVRIPDSLFVRAGYSANAEIVIEEHDSVLTLPEGCVEFDGEHAYVHVLTGDAEAYPQPFERRAVKVGLSDGVRIEITGGLGADERVRGTRTDRETLRHETEEHDRTDE